ncbi:hypothetical protein HK098_000268 [Nowakowskiella sp. JEL0407]|nr:hypothetical protein HK098_000268 [Nowakowskiella sp. JEL0407]
MQGIVAEIVYENQRGSFLLGIPRFSSRLLPTDYPAWSSEKGFFRNNINSIQLPPTWEWVSKWMVDNNGDVDQDGWSYSFAFTSANWSGNPSVTSYVRRRKWIRMRQPKNEPLATDASGGTKSSSSIGIIELLERQRLDREKLDELETCIKDNVYKPEYLLGRATIILLQFDYDIWRLEAIKLLHTLLDDARENLKQLKSSSTGTTKSASATSIDEPESASPAEWHLDVNYIDTVPRLMLRTLNFHQYRMEYAKLAGVKSQVFFL